jgi:hypothetical protein
LGKWVLFLCLALALSTPLLASPLVYVGSYQVDQGPYWWTNPLSYSAREGAALVFGGVYSDYQISIDPNTFDPSTITHTGWYTTWGIGGGQVYQQDFKLQTGSGYNDPGGTGTAISAYTWDNASGEAYTNYVWRDASVPEPSTVSILGTGLVGLAFLRRRLRSR